MSLKSRSPLSRFFVAALFGITTLHGTPARAEARVCSVKLGEVSSAVTRDNVDLPQALRAAAENSLGSIKLAEVAVGRRSILSISLVRMETHRVDRDVTVDCVVSATVRRERNGAIFAIVDGRAQAEGQESPSALEERALRVAVRGAIEQTPLAMR